MLHQEQGVFQKGHTEHHTEIEEIKVKWNPLDSLKLPLEYYCVISSPEEPGGRLNKKDGLTRYGNSHVKDKTS